MKYIKLFELFSITPSYDYEELEVIDPSKYRLYSFKSDNYRYDVVFEKWEDGWDAKHEIGNPFTYSRLRLTNDNVFKITSTVIYITKEFIDKIKPNFLIMNYVGTPEENIKVDDVNKMNKRARLQNNYLKQIEGYSPKYYYRFNPETGFLNTVCIFSINNYDITNAENKIHSYGFKDI